MAIIVETGSGSSTANSYISVVAADTYHADRVNAVWTAATTPNKEAALIASAQYLDAKYKLRWRGDRTHQTQRLDWPRANVVDSDSFLILSTTIPRMIPEAQAEAALRHLSNPLLPDVEIPGTIEMDRVKVGPIEQETRYSGGGPLTSYSLIESMLKGLISSVNTMERA